MSGMKNLFNIVSCFINKKSSIFVGGGFLKSHNYNKQHFRFNGQSAFNYDFMMSLEEKEYPKYLKQAYQHKFMQKLNLRHPKTINEKIQWLKIYDNLPIKTQLADKVLVRNWVENKIGKSYLKPVLWTGKSFDLIPFDILPERFVIKTNHACSWNIFIKSKQKFLSNASIYNYTKTQFDEWLKQNYFGWSDFETQYKNIKPQIIIEELLQDENNEEIQEFEIWCFNSEPQIFQKHFYDKETFMKSVSTYNKYFKNIDLKFLPQNILKETVADSNLKKAAELSKILSKDFKLVRIDWFVFKNKLYFGEMTFTPQSGYFLFYNEYQKWYLELGNMLKL